MPGHVVNERQGTSTPCPPATVRRSPAFWLPAGRGYDNANLILLAHLIHALPRYTVVAVRAVRIDDPAVAVDTMPLLRLIRRGRIREALAATDTLRTSATIVDLIVHRTGPPPVAIAVTRRGGVFMERCPAELVDAVRDDVLALLKMPATSAAAAQSA